MYNPAISTTIDSTGAVMVAAVATADVSNCSDFIIWNVNFQLRKLATNILQFLFCLRVCLNFLLSLQKLGIVFFYSLSTSLFCTV